MGHVKFPTLNGIHDIIERTRFLNVTSITTVSHPSERQETQKDSENSAQTKIMRSLQLV